MINNVDEVDMFICVSFVPFLSACNADYISPELLKEIVEAPNTLSFGCVYEEEQHIFSIIVNRAEELRNEMLSWSGGSGEYFIIHYNESEGISDLIIAANNEASKKRFVKSMFDSFGKKITEDEVVCVSKFIQCHWQINSNKQISEMLLDKIKKGESLKLSFVDHKDIVEGDANGVKVYPVGDFKLVDSVPNLLQNPIIGEGKVN